MKRKNKVLMLFIMVVFLSFSVLQMEANARAGFGRSSGYRSSHSYSSGSSYSHSRSNYSSPRPYNTPYQQNNRGGFMSGMLGGLAGGMLGGMLFRGMGFGGDGGGGLLQIILFAGIAYFIYKTFIKKNNPTAFPGNGNRFNPTIMPQPSYQNDPQDIENGNDLGSVLSDIRRMDNSFSEERFSDQVMDIFFKVQGAWMNRDLTPVRPLLTDEMYKFLQSDIETLISEKKINHLENIAVRKVEIDDAGQEMGNDNITALIYANLLDYTTSDTTGTVIAGSKSDPVKFEEYWSFVRPSGNNPWKLAGIDQN